MDKVVRSSVEDTLNAMLESRGIDPDRLPLDQLRRGQHLHDPREHRPMGLHGDQPARAAGNSCPASGSGDPPRPRRTGRTGFPRTHRSHAHRAPGSTVGRTDGRPAVAARSRQSTTPASVRGPCVDPSPCRQGSTRDRSCRSTDFNHGLLGLTCRRVRGRDVTPTISVRFSVTIRKGYHC